MYQSNRDSPPLFTTSTLSALSLNKGGGVGRGCLGFQAQVGGSWRSLVQLKVF